MKNIKEAINRYTSAWNEKTPELVKAALTECCAPGITYTDKQTPADPGKGAPVIDSIEALTALVMSSHAKVPGRSFALLTEPQVFDGHGLYSWGLRVPGQQEKVGWDYIQYNEEGLIVKIIGFLPWQP